MESEVIDYINSIVLSRNKPEGISIGTCYTMAVEKFNIPQDKVVDWYLKWMLNNGH